MKSTKVERVSNADRAGYALRASPNARRRKDQTYTISLQQGCPINDFPQSVEGALPPFFRRRTHHPGVGKIRISLRPPFNVIGWNGPFNLATTDKNDCRDQKEMIDATQLPTSWTDAGGVDGFVTVAAGRSLFRMAELIELAG